ncbi:acyl carrier protein [Paenibacillus cellulosilyticus]|uniref:Acyl carrier protein n=1 Tax=Paenibacillus cellulosilyticus TaxID=375489 RepID=A0A2V2Z0E3_9BACL|nr:acyl carrier protein [Paenibacillus cellulosilyticus]PWW08317.1 acyl carrier protein [Paenibacillus cellulosilyticus]QKS47917.1 acyl carrier protein [Paenibacillus cellulosilyticus]
MDKILGILTELRPEFDYTQSNDFIADGLLDSFDMISLVSELEEKFNVTIDALDIVPENFGGVEAIVNMIRKNGAEV